MQDVDAFMQRRDIRSNRLARGQVDFLIAEIYLSFKMSADREHPLSQPLHQRRQSPRHLGHALVQSARTASVDKVGNRFGFSQVDPAIEEGTAAEFAWFSNPCTLCGRQRYHSADQVNAAMAMEFRDILAGQGLRTGHQYTHRAVERFAILRIANVAEVKLTGYDSRRPAARMPELV